MNQNLDKTGIPYVWLDEDEWAKLQFKLRSQLEAIWKPCRMYGMGILVDGGIRETLELFDKASQYVRGKDIPIVVRDKPNDMLDFD